MLNLPLVSQMISRQNKSIRMRKDEERQSAATKNLIMIALVPSTVVSSFFHLSANTC